MAHPINLGDEFQRLSLLKFILIIRCIFIFVNFLFLIFFNPIRIYFPLFLFFRAPITL